MHNELIFLMFMRIYLVSLTLCVKGQTRDSQGFLETDVEFLRILRDKYRVIKGLLGIRRGFLGIGISSKK